MDIAITSDIHLSENHKERSDNLEYILKDISSKNIQNIIIAGDIFDKGYNGNNALDKLAASYSHISIYILPGNHDPDIKQSQFHSKNIFVFSQPEIKTFDNREFLFLPYQSGKSIDEVIDNFQNLDILKNKQWILVSHGNYGPYNRQETGNEMGYFPISNKTLQKYTPYRVFLGHIHKPTNNTPIYYPGSPYPLDKNEIGQRRYLVFDTIDGNIKSIYLDNPPIYAQWELFIIPTGNELEQVEMQINKCLDEEKSSYFGTNLEKKLILFVKLNGYAKSLIDFKDKVTNLFKKFSLSSVAINIDNLKQSDNEALNDIAKKTYDKIMEMDIEYSESIRKQAILEAFSIIYSK